MALLLNKQTREKVILRVNHTFGRDSKTNITTLQSPGASRHHATIAWDNEIWKIKDSSSNGTFINKTRMPSGNFQTIPENAKIQFGNIPAETWEVIELSAPMTGLIPEDTNQHFIPLHDAHMLSINGQDILLHLSEDGIWRCDINDTSSSLKSGDKVGMDGHYWYFSDARPCASTATISMSQSQNDIKFMFRASANEEHVSLTLVIDGKNIDLNERNHHYLLLLLAKQRLLDKQKKYPDPEQGWIKKDVLITMMGIAEQHINIQVHRFRKQVASLLSGSSILHQVIERRPGELRLAYSDISIEGGFSRDLRKEPYVNA